jgi:sirohydrochlorin cobaltochelatase
LAPRSEDRRHVGEQRVDAEADDEHQQRGVVGARGEPVTETAVLLCGHGSRDAEGVREFELAAAALRRRLCEFDFAIGYLEFARPTIRDGLAILKSRGARRILAIPAMLLAANHVRIDLPKTMSSFIADNPGLDARLGRGLGIGAKLVRAAADRIAAAADMRIGRAETLLVVVGRGASDANVNSSIAKLARMLAEGMGFGWAEAAFGGVAQPSVDAVLRRAVRQGVRRIIVFPYFLFTGVLVKRIYAQTDAVASLFPELDFVKAPYLRDHQEVLDALCDRVAELGDAPPAPDLALR